MTRFFTRLRISESLFSNSFIKASFMFIGFAVILLTTLTVGLPDNEIRLDSFDPSGTSMPTMPGWCNGTAGHLLLFSTASKLFKNTHFLDTALTAGTAVWEEQHAHASLCCGLAGRAYALLNLYNATGDSEWLGRAEKLCDIAVKQSRDESAGDEFVPHSLFKGAVGLMTLCIDLENPARATMPLFEFEK